MTCVRGCCAIAGLDGAALLATVPWQFSSVELRFDAGDLGLPVRPEPIDPGPDGDRLMVRGDLITPGIPLAWPPSSFT